MEGIARQPVAHHFRQRLSTAREGMLERLEYHHRAALTEHEAIAILVERATGPGGVIVPGGHRLHVAEGGDRQSR